MVNFTDIDAAFPSVSRGWRCTGCGLECPYWYGGERFPTCVKCASQNSLPPIPVAASTEPEFTYVYGAIHAGRPDEVRSTPKAILFSWDGRVSIWVPRSCIKQDNADGLHVAAWFAKKHLVSVINKTPPNQSDQLGGVSPLLAPHYRKVDVNIPAEGRRLNRGFRDALDSD